MITKEITHKKGQLETLINEALFNYDLPGLSLGIIHGEEEPLILSAGYSNYLKKTPLTPDHVFHMASITKLFTGSSILKLANEGKFSLDEPLVSLLPWFSMLEDKNLDVSYKTITPRQILSHTAGLPDVTDYHWELEEKDDDSLYRYCTSEDVKDRTLLWSPLENKFSYSNIGYELLGALIQEKSGLLFEDYVANNYFGPLQMTESTLKTYERTPNCSLAIEDLEKAGVLVPYEKDSNNNIVVAPNFPYHRGHGPSSTLTAPIADVLKWGQTFFEPSQVITDTFGNERPWEPIAKISQSTESIGLSWFIRQEKTRSFYGHEGSDDGFRSSFWICPQEKLAVVVCSNLSKSPVKKINKKIYEILLND
jgi:CubicO group peptidase (beta-lactamase class C family)